MPIGGSMTWGNPPPPTVTNLSNLYHHVGGGGNPYTRGQSGNNFKLPLPNPTGAGNCILLGLSYDSGATPTITDNNGNTWPGTATKKVTGGAGYLDSAIYVLPNANATPVDTYGNPTTQTIITVTFGSSVRTFQYKLTELYGIATSSPVVGSSSNANSTTLAAGSFTPIVSNTLVWAYFAKADASNVPGSNVTSIVAGSGFDALDEDIGWANAADSMTAATEIYAQATAAPVNPSITVSGNSDPWNSLAVALQVSPGAGTPPSNRIRIVRINHFSTVHFPATGNYKLQIPALGNLRVLQCPDPNLNSLTITDSEGGTWLAGVAGSGFWYRPNTTPNSNLSVTIAGGGGDNTLSWRFIDIANALAAPYDSSIISAQTVNSLTSFTSSPAPSPSTANGIVLGALGLGQGPGLGITSPSGAIWDYPTYTGEQDEDLLVNADLFGHYYNSASGPETWNWLITSVASNSTSGGFIYFKGV